MNKRSLHFSCQANFFISVATLIPFISIATQALHLSSHTSYLYLNVRSHTCSLLFKLPHKLPPFQLSTNLYFSNHTSYLNVSCHASLISVSTQAPFISVSLQAFSVHTYFISIFHSLCNVIIAKFLFLSFLCHC